AFVIRHSTFDTRHSKLARMTSKPKSRKLPVADTRGDQPAPSELPVAPHTNDGAIAPAPSKSARKKRIAPPSRPSEMELLTVEERLKKLAKLPSLEVPPTEPDRGPLVDAATRPPAPLPPPPAAESEPGEEGPAPSSDVDRGSTIPENYGLDRL